MRAKNRRILLMNLKTIIFIGRSGCGKGTQIELMRDYFTKNDSREFFHLEAGARFRKFIADKYYASQLARDISLRGELQPEFLSVWGWVSELIENLTADKHLLIDGTPRRIGEAHILESVFEFFKREGVEIVYIKTSPEWSIDKMKKRGRGDDVNMTSLKNRMAWFEKDVMPVVEYFRNHDAHNFYEINGEQTVEEVQKDILEALKI